MCEHELTLKNIEDSRCSHCLFDFNIVVAIPLSEDGLHKVFSVDCACKPEMKFKGLDLIIFHPLMEPELAVEWTKEIINISSNP